MSDTPQTPAPKVNMDAFSARLYDHGAGKWIDVPAHQVDDAIKTGNYTFNQGQELPVVSPDGEMGTIPADQAYGAFHDGYRWATPGLQQQADSQAKEKIAQDNFGNQPLTAAVAGGLRMATGGISDVVNNVAGVSDAAQEVANRNKGVTLAGEVAGAIIPNPIGKAVGLIGEAAAPIARAVFPEATSALGQAAVNVGVKAASEAASNTLYGVGSALSEQALGHPDDVADNLLSHIGTAALIGGGFGAAIGAASEARPALDKLVERAVNGGQSLVEKAVTKQATGKIEAAASQAGLSDVEAKYGAEMASDKDFVNLVTSNGYAAVDKALQQAKEAVEDTSKFSKQFTSALDSNVKDLEKGGQDYVRGLVEKENNNVMAAADTAFKESQTAKENLLNMVAAQPPKPLNSAALTSYRVGSEAYQGIGDQLVAEGNSVAQRLGRKIQDGMRGDALTEGQEATKLLNLRSALKSSALDKLDGASKGLVDELMGSIDTRLSSHSNSVVSEGFKAVSAAEKAAEALQNTAAKVGDASLNPIDRLVGNPQARQTAQDVLSNIGGLKDQIAAYTSGTLKPAQMSALKDSIEATLAKVTGRPQSAEHILETVDMLGAKANVKANLDKIAALQQGMDPSLSLLDRVVATKSALGEKVTPEMEAAIKMQNKIDMFNRIKDLKTTGVSPQRLLLATLSALKGNPMGAARNILLGLQGSTVSKQFEVLSRLQAQSAKGAALIQKSISAAASAAVSGGGKIGRAAAAAATEGPTKKEALKTYQALKNSPVQPSSAPLAPYAPGVHQAIQNKQQAIQSFIQSKMPEDPLQQDSININKTGYVPSDHELASFGRSVNGAVNPLKVIDNLSRNKASPEEMDALQQVHPQIFNKLKSAVTDAILDGGKDVPYQTKLQLSTLFGISTDYTMRPDFVARMQVSANSAQSSQPQPGQQPQGKAPHLDLKPLDNVQTPGQQTANKG